MIALDTNVLVYAHREDSPHHASARAVVEDLANDVRRFAVPWPCVHEFLAIVTHPRIYEPPTDPATAVQAMRTLLELPHVVALAEGPDHLDRLTSLVERGNAVGPKIHDARVAAICLAHGVSELWTADRDFSYFPSLRTRNPLTR